jgi:hypothetical protein
MSATPPCERDPFARQFAEGLTANDAKAFESALITLSALPLGIGIEGYAISLHQVLTPLKAPRLEAVNVNIFCPTCDRREAAKAISLDEVGEYPEREPLGVGSVFYVRPQYLAVSYRCQSCEDQEQLFLVERDGNTLRLVGRVPIETVSVHKDIPKPESKFLRDAFIARNSGKTLAGLFYLRTFIEQYVRRKTDDYKSEHVTDVADAYGRTIPELKRSQMPSLRDLYSKLSVDVHAASENESTFEECVLELVSHFEFRRMFKLEDTKAKTDTTVPTPNEGSSAS